MLLKLTKINPQYVKKDHGILTLIIETPQKNKKDISVSGLIEH